MRGDGQADKREHTHTMRVRSAVFGVWFYGSSVQKFYLRAIAQKGLKPHIVFCSSFVFPVMTGRQFPQKHMLQRNIAMETQQKWPYTLPNNRTNIPITRIRHAPGLSCAC